MTLSDHSFSAFFPYALHVLKRRYDHFRYTQDMAYEEESRPAFAFSFKNEGKELLRITQNGKLLWFGDQTDAIKAFWDACEEMNPLKARVEELEDRIRDMGLVP